MCWSQIPKVHVQLTVRTPVLPPGEPVVAAKKPLAVGEVRNRGAAERNRPRHLVLADHPTHRADRRLGGAVGRIHGGRRHVHPGRDHLVGDQAVGFRCHRRRVAEEVCRPEAVVRPGVAVEEAVDLRVVAARLHVMATHPGEAEVCRHGAAVGLPVEAAELAQVGAPAVPADPVRFRA